MSDLGPLAPAAPPVSSTPATAPVAQPPAPQTPAPTSGQTPPSPGTLLQGSAAAIDAAASELSQGGQISAQVVARDQAALVIRTAAGNLISLAGDLAAKLEQANIAVLTAALKIQLTPQNPQQATVLSANGVTLQPPLPALAQPPTVAQLALAVSPPQPSASPTPVLPQPGQTLSAVVVAPPAPGTPAAAMPLPAGSQLQVVVQSATLPATPATPAGATPSMPLPAAAGTPAAIPPAATPAAATPAVAPAVTVPAPSIPTTLSAPLAAALLQQAAATPPTAPQPILPQAQAAQQALPSALANQQPLPQLAMAGQVITGVVSGQTANGQMLVSTPQGILTLSLSQPLPAGTQLSLELAAITRPPPPTATALGPPPLGSVLTRLQGEWPTLQQTLNAVRATDPVLAQRLQDMLPQANARLASAALQFMAAAAAGSAQAWLGAETVRKLEGQGKGDLLKKLDDDFRELGRLNSRQGDTDWQAVVMPMLIGGKVEPIQIFMRRRKNKEKKQSQTRFIIDFDLESTGPIQFDGFVGPKQLDLVLRSESEFGPAFRLDVTGIFTSALEITGMVGSIRFHDREKPLPWPSPELEGRAHSTEIKA